MADPDDDFASQRTENPQQMSPQERKRRFAKAITRAEFGRFYWDEELERQLRSGVRPPRKAVGTVK